LGNKTGKVVLGYENFTPDYTVNQIFSLKEFGFDIDLISTPGHSSGSISIIVNNEIALVGDTMIGIFKSSIFPPFADNPEELIKSWEKLLLTDCRLFLPGHGGEIKKNRVERCIIDYKS